MSFRIAPGERVYAIGDIHGRADLFANLLSQIEEDNAHRGSASTRLVLLGDVVDRGPASAELISRLMRYTRLTDRIVVLQGNHEMVMEAVLTGSFDALHDWLEMGGAATLRSFGLDIELLRTKGPVAIRHAARKSVSKDVLAWIRRLPLTFRSGDVLFVHAGIRPGVDLSRQLPEDLLWIGDEFTQSELAHPVLVVHGHTIVENGPQVRSNRIGLDTGAYRTGRLTAAGFEGDDIWFLST